MDPTTLGQAWNARKSIFGGKMKPSWHLKGGTWRKGTRGLEPKIQISKLAPTSNSKLKASLRAKRVAQWRGEKGGIFGG